MDVTNINIYAPNTGAPKKIKQGFTDLKRETDGNTAVMGWGGSLKLPFPSMDRWRQKINKENSL